LVLGLQLEQPCLHFDHQLLQVADLSGLMTPLSPADPVEPMSILFEPVTA